MPDKSLFRYPQAFQVWEKLEKELSPVSRLLTLAGSMRRGCNQVHDLDIICWPLTEIAWTGADLFNPGIEYQYPGPLLDLLFNRGWVRQERIDSVMGALRSTYINHNQGGSTIEYGFIFPFEYEKISVEVYTSLFDGSNFGALLQLRTGSKNFNIYLAQRAQKLGLHFKAGFGLFRNGERVDEPGTEEQGIFDALHLSYTTPQNRSI